MPHFSGESEGEALDDMLEQGDCPELDRLEQQARIIAKQQMLKLYETAKAARTGTQCICPSCAKPFTKKSYQQAFCSNKGRNNCKDSYWNRANDDRSMRAQFFASRR